MQEMERGDKGGVVLDSSGPDEGGEIDAAITANTKDQDALNEPAGNEDINGGGENSPVREDGEKQEGEVLPEGQGAEVQDQAPQAGVELEQFKADILKTLDEKLKPAPEPVKPLTEEDWAKQENEWGVPRTAIQKQIGLAIRVKNEVMEAMDARFAKYELSETIQNFAKTPGMADATRYKAEIQEFLKDYDTKHWTNPVLLQKAVVYGRGVHANANLNKVRTDGERNKKIAGVARPSSPTSGGVKRTAAPVLNGAHKEVANLMGETEFNKYKTRPSRTIE